ncbi:retrovirus-related Pol polyprotein from transposon TNT 1-94 [Trichonephila clavipes]|nr:retrovirus-related Pol polyprotein from transposon TNT 1-94 [Trichonephila clavipes]
MLHHENGKKNPIRNLDSKKPKLNYLKIFGCVAYFHVPKVLRNKFEVPGRRRIMLGYARERRGCRIYDIKNQKVIEERSVKFNESLKCSNYLGEVENETWDIDSFFEVSPERNEINQNTDNGVLSNFEINNGPLAIENDNSIPLQTPSSPQTGRIQLPSVFGTHSNDAFLQDQGILLLKEQENKLRQEGNNIPQRPINNLITSMQNRCVAVLAARGDHT